MIALSSLHFCPCDGRQAGLWYLPARWRYTTKGPTDARPQPLGPGGQAAFHIHTRGTMTIGETYGRPIMVLFGHPGSQIFPGLVTVPVGVDNEISMHRGASLCFINPDESAPAGPGAPMIDTILTACKAWVYLPD